MGRALSQVTRKYQLLGNKEFKSSPHNVREQITGPARSRPKQATHR